MKKLLTALLALTFSSFAMANSAQQHHGVHLTPMQQELMEGMNTMHQDMMSGMASPDADIAFAAGMIPHHQGAIKMAEIELKYGKDPELRKLAENIIQAQEAEIQFMQQWLKAHQK